MAGIIVIGENLNTSRKCKADGKLVAKMPGGGTGYPYKDLAGNSRFVDLTRFLQRESVQKSGMVPYIAAAVENRDRDYIEAAIREQVVGGADILDLCVDEVSTRKDERMEHMVWLVQTAQELSGKSMAIDSSDSDVIRAGLEVYDAKKSRPFVNSTNLEPERLVLLPMVVEYKAMIAGNASGPEGIPPDDRGRVGNLTQLMAKMDEYKIPMADRFLDPLVFPVGAGADMTTGEFKRFGQFFLNAVRELRETFGEDFHLFGGFSNVSFGMPQRKLLNMVFTYLCIDAGCDCIMVDPKQITKKDAEDYYFAARCLRGTDEFSTEFLEYARPQ